MADPSNGNESQNPSNRHPRKCRARKSNGDLCDRWAIAGGTVCPSHGGRAPQVKAAAARTVEAERAQRAAATFGLPVEVDPHRALLDELHRTAGHVAWLGDLIARLEHVESLSPHVGGSPPADADVDEFERSTSGRSGLKQYTRDGTLMWEKPSVWVDMYQAERKHLAAVAASCIKAGIEERRVEIAQQQADVLVAVLRGVLADLGVADRPDVNQVVARHLRAVAS